MKVEYEQLSLFELFNENMLGPTPFPVEEPTPHLLKDGQSVWVVRRGEVFFYKVVGQPYMCEDKTWRYHAKNECWTNFSENEIGLSVFTEESVANELAEIYLTYSDVIRKEDIKPIEVKAYHFIRSCDEREMVAFYAILPDGKAYIKNFYTYHHIIDYGSVDKAKKKLEKDFLNNQGFRCENAEELLNPMEHIEFHNMYPCREDVDWDYADEGYSGCIGHDRLFLEH